MAAKIAPKFYVDPALWAVAQAAMEDAGLTNSEAMSRLLAFFVATEEKKRSKLLATSATKAMQIHADRTRKPKP